jgi:DNA polymerase/3'-5' exonuclease PolX
MYYTGSETFNKEMRIKALNYGYTFGDTGLTPLQNNAKS